MKDNWERKKLNDISLKLSLNKLKIKQKDYLLSGLYPIIDQGQELIGGYYNDENLLIPDTPPFIIFGDHTKVKKYIDFAFVPGADGIKVLKAKQNTNPKFLFYLLHTVRIEDKGYARHFQLLERESFLIPNNLNIQEQIVSKIEELFSELDKGIEEIKRAQEQVKVYRQSVLKWAFEGKLTNENVKDGELPGGWEWKKIGEIGKVKGGKRLPKGHTYSEQKSPFPYLRVTDFKNQSISKEKLKYLSEETQSAIKNYTISKNDVFISIAGTIGETGTIPEDLDGANLTENAAKITDLKNTFNKFLALYLSGNQAQFQIKEKTKTTTQPKLSLYRIEDIDIPLPHELKEQQLIVREIESRFSLADQLERELENSLLQAEALRQSILKKAFEGELVN